MTALVQALQGLSGVLWLIPAALLLPVMVRAWNHTATGAELLSTPTFFYALLQACFTVRWFIWPHSLAGMGFEELEAWAGLYSLSCLCALGVTVKHWVMRGER